MIDWNLLVSCLGLVVAAATLFFVLLDRAERRRATHAARFEMEYRGEQQRVLNGLTETTAIWLRLTNAGGSTAKIVHSMLVGAQVLTVDNPLPPKLCTPAVPHDFKVEPGDVDSAWLLIVYIDQSDERYAHAMWIPATITGSRSDEWHQQAQALGRGWRYRWRVRHARGSVGPGGDLRQKLRRGARTSAEDHIRMTAIAQKEGGQTLHI